ncbi:cytochrome P450 89A2-like [Cucumis melo var. makuwa]|uniref:Cytochrome P450 89A2-like n=1 Tax=Cucumis melo var. makuwa TaxID=1194695 RepID=A0A5D3C836_CUCMM|nr:cytochrome P450 89A2-like [Cucumis melo var. makuwa]
MDMHLLKSKFNTPFFPNPEPPPSSHQALLQSSSFPPSYGSVHRLSKWSLTSAPPSPNTAPLSLSVLALALPSSSPTAPLPTKPSFNTAPSFSDRPPAPPLTKILTSNQHSINSAAYGPLWRLLRRNLTSQILHPSHIRSYGRAREWVLGILLGRLFSHSESGSPVYVVDHFQYAMFCLLVLMCFGDKLEESQIKEVENVQRTMLLNFSRFGLLNLSPKYWK